LAVILEAFLVTLVVDAVFALLPPSDGLSLPEPDDGYHCPQEWNWHHLQ